MALLRDLERNGRKILIKFITGLFGSSNKNVNLKEIKSVIILRLDERLGNVVLLNSVIQSFIKNKIPVSLVVCKKYGRIYEYNDNIKNIIYFNKKALFNPFNIIKLVIQLKSSKYDLLFDASNPNDLSTLSLIVMILIKAKMKIGFDRKNSEAVLNKTVKRPAREIHILDCYKLLFQHLHLKFYKIPMLDLPTHLFLKYRSLAEEKRKILIVNPAGRDEKQWDVKKMLAFIQTLDLKKFKLIAIFGPNELKIKDEFKQKELITISPKDVLDLIAVLSMGKVYIGNDSGPMHLAASLGLAILAIYKPSASKVFGPCAKNYEMIVTENPFSVPVKQVEEKFKKLLKRLSLS